MFSAEESQEFLHAALRAAVARHGEKAHDIIDEIIASLDNSRGRGVRKSNAGGATSLKKRDPPVRPSRVDIKKTSLTFAQTRSAVEPMDERVSSSCSLGELYTAAVEDCKRVVTEISEKCRAHRKRFFDDTFYFDRRSVMYPDGSPNDCTVAEPSFAGRLRDLYPNHTLFADEISAEDMTQGYVGDCFFIGAVNAVASNGGRDALRNLFVAYDVETGVYGVCFYKCGTWEWVIVDDFVALVSNDKRNKPQMLYASCNPDQVEFWPMILEKAYAKMHYNWDMIDGGWAGEAIVDLVGGAGTTYDLRGAQREMSFDDFRREVDDPKIVLGCAVGAHVGSGDGAQGRAGEQSALFGLLHGHQYAVIAAAKTSDGSCFVKVRNPWGNDAEWQGPYSDRHAAWYENPLHKKELQPTFEADGEFWMTWQDFRHNFSDVDVVHTYRPEQTVTTIYSTAENTPLPNTTYIIRAFKATKVVVIVCQEDPKMKYQTDHAKQKTQGYNRIKMRVAKIQSLPSNFDDLPERRLHNIAALEKRDRQVYTECELEAGDYCVTVTAKGHTDLFLRVIGDDDASFDACKFTDAHKLPTPSQQSNAQAGNNSADQQQQQQDQQQNMIAAFAPPNPYARLGLDQANFEEVCQRVFQELSGGYSAINRAASLNGVRLLVTLGAGLDESFAMSYSSLVGVTDAVTEDQFVDLSKQVVENWSVLNAQ